LWPHADDDTAARVGSTAFDRGAWRVPFANGELYSPGREDRDSYVPRRGNSRMALPLEIAATSGGESLCRKFSI
jgi:hypothetical protein